MKLAGKSALVTGGYGGFGKSCAAALARDGAVVTLMGRRPEALEQAREIILSHVPGAQVAITVGDATKETDIDAAVSAALSHGGGVDIVIPTVGGTTTIGPVMDHSYTSFMDDLKLNVVTAFLAVRAAIPHMHHGGTFVFISSNAASMAFPNLAGYCAAKAALDQFVRCAANDLGPRGIRLNSVRPGLTHTDGADAAFANEDYVASFVGKIPLGRTGVPSDISEAVRFLAGPESSWITGQSFAIDGGHELRGPA